MPTGLPSAQAHQWRLGRDLVSAIQRAGGRDRVLRCGATYVGPLRGPLMAYALRVRKRDVEPDAPPTSPGTIFRSRRLPRERALPDVPPGFTMVGTSGP